jgi:hypothetical protein
MDRVFANHSHGVSSGQESGVNRLQRIGVSLFLCIAKELLEYCREDLSLDISIMSSTQNSRPCQG